MERVLLGGGPAGDTTGRGAIRLRRDGRVGADPERGLQVIGPFCVLSFGQPDDALTQAVRQLATADWAPDELGAQVMAVGGVSALMRLQRVLQRLDHEGLLEHSLLVDGVPLVRLRPVGRGSTRLPARLDEPVALSRFATVRAEDGRLVARAPGSHLAVDLAPTAGALIAHLAVRRSVAEHADAAGLHPSVVGDALRHLAAAGVVTAGAVDPADAERSQAQWSVTDQWLHAVSRGPKTVSGYGGTYPQTGRFEPLPAVAPGLGGRSVELRVPDLSAVAGGDPPLTEVLESRRSIREHDPDAPITLDQLGQLLYRAAHQSPAFAGSDGQQLARRPYPSGGAVHELEIYPLVTDCAGLTPGLWHYRAAEHRLELISAPNAATAALVAGARDGAIMAADPQVTLLITARFGRVMWKYESVAYSLILKHVGVLYQTVYLIGAAMNLAVCGLGGGDSAEFATASGLDPFAEATVGELVLGSVPDVLSHPYRLESIADAGGRKSSRP